MKTGNASGIQVAFLVFAVTLLAVPLSNALLSGLPATPDEAELVRRAMPFLLGASLILLVPGLRRQAIVDLATPIPASHRMETGIVAFTNIAIPFAVVVTTAWWIASSEGLLGIERRMAQDSQLQATRAFSPAGIFWVAVAAVVAPIMEELVFRGFLYRAFEKRWGWIASMMLTSTFFAWYHPQFINAFLFSVALICLLRRTGSLRAPIIAHAVGNALLWYPLAGQYLLPVQDQVTAPPTWIFHLACALLVMTALPAYVWAARTSRNGHPEPAVFHAPLPQ